MPDAFPIAFGRYELLERLAVGGMAELFLARAGGAHGFAKTFVIKRILPHLAADQQFTTMFIDEAKLTARLAHPKIAQTFELGHEAGRLYIAMEYVEGLDVLAILRECAHRRVRIAPELSVYVCKETLDALDFAHKMADDTGKPLGIVHRDVSPSNVLVSRRGDVKLVDFGIAHALTTDHQTKAGTLKGKYGYMSPEQVLGNKVTPKSDLFSVAVVLAEMLTGRRLFAAPNELDVLLMVRDVKLDRLDRFGGHIPPDLMRVMKRGLAKLPSERYPDAAGFRDALDEWLFDNRHRVGPRNVADLVESLHADAIARREAAMAESLANAAVAPPSASQASLPAATGPSLDLGAAASTAPDRAPGAVDRMAAGAPVESPAPSIAAASGELASGAVDAGDDETRRIPRIAPPASVGVEPGYIDLGDLMDGPPPAAPPPAAARPEARAETRAESGGARAGKGGRTDAAPARTTARGRAIAGSGGSPRVARKSGQETAGDEAGAGRFPDIGSAVASVSRRPEPDPAASDFDGTDISDLAGKKQRRPPMPSEAELARAPRPAPPAVAEILDTPGEAGDLGVNPPIKIMFQLATTKATGLLAVSVGEIKKEIYVVNGVPEFVSSNLAGELFGAYLVSEAAISNGELDMALAMLPYFGGKLGDTLVGLGLMKPLDVFRHLTRQVRTKLLDVCTWTKGVYTWYPGKKNAREAFPLDLDPFEVLGAGAMACDGDFLDGWAGARLASVLRPAPQPKIVPERFKLGKVGREVLAALDGKGSLGEILRRFGKDEDRRQFLRVLYLFTLVELVRAG